MTANNKAVKGREWLPLPLFIESPRRLIPGNLEELEEERGCYAPVPPRFTWATCLASTNNPVKEAGCLYSPGCLEVLFSETRLPVDGILGSSDTASCITPDR